MKVFRHLIPVLLFAVPVVSSAQTLHWGGKLEGNSSSKAEVTKVVADHNGYYYAAGWYIDSLQLDLAGTEGPTGYVLHASAPGIKHSFVVKYDNYGDMQWGFSLGDATDSLVIRDLAIDNYWGRVYIAGTLKGTVNFDPSGSSLFSSVTGEDGFFANYDYFSGALNQVTTLGSTGNTNGITALGFDYFGDIYITGYFTGTLPLLAGTINATNTDAFIAQYDYTYYNNQYVVGLSGSGNEYGSYIAVDNSNGVVTSGYFDTDIDLDGGAGTVSKTSAGGTDAYYVHYASDFNYISGFKIGGTGNDKPKGIVSTDGFYNNAVLMTEYQNTINLNPTGTANFTSAGSTDIAVSSYSLDGSYWHGASFGNTAANPGFFSVMGITAMPARSAPGNFYVGFGYSGTLDVDPTVATQNITSSNTPVNSVVIELDSLLHHVTDFSVEAQKTTGMGFSYYNPTDVILGGSFTGSNVDLLPYANTLLASHSPNSTGFITFYDECHLTDTIVMEQPYQCGTCTAELTVHVTGALGGLDAGNTYWTNGTYGLSATNLCPGTYNVGVTDMHGCYLMPNTGYDILAHGVDSLPSGVINTVPSTCNNNFGSASIVVSNAIAPYTIDWSNGDTTATADSLTAGSYTVNITDSLNCYVTQSFLISDSDGPVITVNTTSSPGCSGGAGSIDVTVTGGVAPISFLWSNGATTEDLTSVPAGTYALIVTDANGCRSQVCVTLTSPDPMSLTNSSYTTSTCGATDGSIDVDVTGGTAPYTYLWDATAGSQTSDSAVSLGAGMYSITVTDNNGCTATKMFGLSDPAFSGLNYYYSGNPSCYYGPGYIQVYTYGTAPFTWLWNTGETTESLYGITEGGTFLEQTTDYFGCKTVATFQLDQQLPFTPDLCMVTVDSSGTQNVVVWDKSSTPDAVSYNVYREGFCSSSDFLPIGSVSHDSLSVFYDTVVNTDTRSWSYYVTAIDSCGYESLPSEINRTIHLTSIFNTSGDVVLNWDAYVGREVSEYDIYRVDPVDPTTYTMINSVSGSTLVYIDTDDFTPYDGEDIEYYIEAVPVNPCFASRAFNQNASRSNHTRLAFAAPDTSTSAVPSVQTQEDIIHVFPNPANDHVNITISGSNSNYKAVMLNHVGQVVSSFAINRSTSIPTHTLNQGVYYLRLTNDQQQTKMYKLVVAH